MWGNCCEDLRSLSLGISQQASQSWLSQCCYLQPVAAADDDWSVDTSDAAVQARMGNLTSGVKGLALTDDSEKPQEERFNLFYGFVKVCVLKIRMLIFGFLLS